MRILTLTYEYPPIGGGGGVVAAALNKQLVANGHTIDVVTSAMPGLPREEMVDGVQVHRTWCFRRQRHFTTAMELSTTLLPAYRKAARLIEQRRPDLIHTHFALPSGIVARELSVRYGIPYVLTAHGSDIPNYNPDRFGILHRMVAPIWRRTMLGAAAITSPSQFLGTLMQESLSVPYTIIPNGYTPEAEASEAPRPKRNLVLVVARLFPRKGVQHFIDSVAAMTGDWEFVIAGDGPYMSALKEQAARVGANVRFVGFLDKPTLRGLYEEARILVFPSIRENFPMVLLEAMDAGCAVITTDAEGCAEVVGDAGVVFKKGNIGELRESLIALMNDPQRCAALSKRAVQRASRYRWHLIAAQYQELFMSVTHQTPQPASIPNSSAATANTAPFAEAAVPLALEYPAADSPRRALLSAELLEFTHDAIIIWEMDGAGILYWNQAAEQLYGYTREQAYGQTTHALLKTQLSGGIQKLETKIARYGVWVGELKHVTRDGRRVQVEGRLAVMSQRDGRWLVLEVNRDITDIKKAQDAQQAAERQLACLRELNE